MAIFHEASTTLRHLLVVLDRSVQSNCESGAGFMRASQNAPAHKRRVVSEYHTTGAKFATISVLREKKNLHRSGMFRDYSSFTPSVGSDPAYPFDGFL